ncbi:MAG TPA: 30S ribosomal protein S10 [Candidatus Omnitrophica bacterium]|nr:30S ribosomal protein S10 [Candidatus Omnitrophota bacterium]
MAKKKEKKTNQQRVTVKLKAYDHRVLDQSISEIVKTVVRTGAKAVGPVPLPTKLERYTVLRSPHVNKKSMEAFQLKIHKRLLEIVEPTRKTTDALMKLNLPAGVHVEIKL